MTFAHAVRGSVFQSFHEEVRIHELVWASLVPFFVYMPYVTFGVLEPYCCR